MLDKGLGRRKGLKEGAEEGRGKGQGLLASAAHFRSHWLKAAALAPVSRGPRGMLSRRQLPYDRLRLPPERRLRANVQDLISSNVVSGQRGAQLINDCVSASATGVSDLQTTESTSGMKNAARKFRRDFFRKGWPPLYHCQVRGWDPKSETEQLMDLAMMLPHEILHQLHHFGERSVLLETSSLDGVSSRHVQRARAESGRNDLVALGVWQDGAPCFWDRSMSAEIISLMLPWAAGR